MKEKLRFGGFDDFDNVAVHNFLKGLMMRGERLTVGMYNDTYSVQNYPCVWIGTKDYKPFKYILFQKSFDWLMNYLITGEYEDAGVAPLGIKDEDEEVYKGDFQLDTLKGFVEENIKMQFTPIFLDRDKNISAIAPFKYGKILFKTKRTAELLDYLRGKEVNL